jgi:hypothetical protein
MAIIMAHRFFSSRGIDCLSAASFLEQNGADVNAQKKKKDFAISTFTSSGCKKKRENFGVTRILPLKQLR